MRKEKIVGSRERGQTLILFVLAIGVLVGFMSMAIDVGLLFEDRRELQNSADAAALAGVQDLPLNPVKAKAKAQEWVVKHNISADKIKTIEVRTTSFPNDTLFVQLEQDFDWIFGRVLGLQKSTIGGQAAARTGSLAGGHDMMPWAIMQGDTSCLDVTGKAIFGATCSVKLGAGRHHRLARRAGLRWQWRWSERVPRQHCRREGRNGILSRRLAEDPPPCHGTVDALTGNKVGPTGQGIDDRLAKGAQCDERTARTTSVKSLSQRGRSPPTPWPALIAHGSSSYRSSATSQSRPHCHDPRLDTRLPEELRLCRRRKLQRW